MVKLMDKKIATILRSRFLFISTLYNLRFKESYYYDIRSCCCFSEFLQRFIDYYCIKLKTYACHSVVLARTYTYISLIVIGLGNVNPWPWEAHIRESPSQFDNRIMPGCI